MKRAIGLLALAAAGAGYLLYTEKGRSMLNSAGQSLQDGYGRLRDQMGSGPGEVDNIVQNALAAPHEDTVVARAFEEATAG